MNAAVAWFWYVVAGFLVAWAMVDIVHIVLDIIGNRCIMRLMRDFESEFPDRCFFCSYYRNVLYELSPPHRCKEWGTHEKI